MQKATVRNEQMGHARSELGSVVYIRLVLSTLKVTAHRTHKHDGSAIGTYSSVKGEAISQNAYTNLIDFQ